MSYTKRYLDEVERIIQDKRGYDGKISDEAIAAEAKRIADTPSEFYPIMGRVKPEEALDWILEAWTDDDCDTIDTIAHDLLARMDCGAKPDVSQEHLRALLAIAQRWGEDEVQRRGDEAVNVRLIAAVPELLQLCCEVAESKPTTCAGLRARALIAQIEVSR